MLDRIDRVDTFENVFDGVIDRVFTGFDSKALVSHILQSGHLAHDILLGKLFARNMLVFIVIRTVNAAVDAIIGQIQRREDDNAVAVEILFDLLGKVVHFSDSCRLGTGKKYRRFAVGKSFAKSRFFNE